MSLRDLLAHGARELGLDLSEGQVERFFLYMDLLKLWSARINLTTVTEDREVVLYHFVDSLTLLPLITDGSKVLDVGSGAGFPGIPIKIANPTLSVTLLDSSSKKVFFMREVIRRLGLEGIEALWERAESGGLSYKEGRFDVVVSRAVGSIKRALSISIPRLSPSGRVVLMRGKMGDAELEAMGGAGEGFKGVELVEVRRLSVPGTDRERTIVVFKKGEEGMEG